MTRKHFDAIAAAFAAEGRGIDTIEDLQERYGAKTTHERLARDIAGTLAASNPRFDRARFLRASGVDL